MEVTKIIVTIALTFAITIALAMKNIGVAEENRGPLINIPIDSSTTIFPQPDDDQTLPIMPSKRVSRFLKEEAKNPRAADHCHKDGDVCNVQGGGQNSTCCNNKCMDLATDEKNCGACKNKCKFTNACCRGTCVNISFDKRHCGACNRRCKIGEYCVYGMCNYA